MKDIVIKQGYVPSDCTLPGQMIFCIVNEGKDPCVGCHENRNVCKGRLFTNDMNGKKVQINKE